MCAMAKRIDRIDLPAVPDIFILEFAVNDYQGQDDIEWVDHKTDIFFDGFQQKVLCAEAVIYKLLTKYPSSAILFFEFRSFVLQRKTAQLLHTGVAQHYQIPIISYGDAIFPHYYNLLHQLNSSTLYSVPVGESIQPYPFGCIPECDLSKIAMLPPECFSVCDHMNAKEPLHKSTCTTNEIQQLFPTEQRIPCYLSFVIHDSIHPSYIGHQLARDLLIEMIAVTTRDLCHMNHKSSISSNISLLSDVEMTTGEALITTTTTTFVERELRLYHPKPYGFLASADLLSKYTDFILVKDTMYTFGKQDILQPDRKSDGFTYYADGAGGRKGLICTSNGGDEYMEFDINLPIVTGNDCYVIYIAALKSYTNMGMYTISLTNVLTNNATTKIVDGIWKPRISVPADLQINSDNIHDDGSCTGKCIVKITTHPQILGRAGNKVKIMTLSVRKCIIPTTSMSEQSNQLDDPTSWLVV
jgi:hypothetical protein